jgi:hypothetical protein
MRLECVKFEHVTAYFEKIYLMYVRAISYFSRILLNLKTFQGCFYSRNNISYLFCCLKETW